MSRDSRNLIASGDRYTAATSLPFNKALILVIVPWSGSSHVIRR
jgi:hypothetical protein